MAERICAVALDVNTYAIDKLYDYILPPELSELAQVGSRVLVPFGRTNKKTEGVILAFRSDITTDVKLKYVEIPVILVINKIDKVSKETLIMAISEFKDYKFSEIVPVSAKENDNITHLIEVIKKYLKDNVKYYSDDILTSSSTEFMVQEVVREKLLHNTEDEIPHSITCQTTNIEYKKDIVNINVDIIVDKQNLKKIIIGHNGEMLKKIGTLARCDLEEMMNKKVYLELYVKVVENWKDKERYLKELGFTHNEY